MIERCSHLLVLRALVVGVGEMFYLVFEAGLHSLG